MPVEIKRSITISADACTPWRVPDGLVREIDSGVGISSFVKLAPREPGLIRMVCAGVMELPKWSVNCKMSIGHTDGYTRLVALRNTVAFSAPADASADLFCDDDLDEPKAAKSASKRRRLTQSDRVQLKAHPEIIQVPVAGVQGRDAMDIAMLRPVHPCEDLSVALDAIMFEHVVRFIQHHELSQEVLLAKRQYGDEERPKGLWANGSGSFVVKQPLNDDESNPKKYGRVSIAQMLGARTRPALADISENQPNSLFTD